MPRFLATDETTSRQLFFDNQSELCFPSNWENPSAHFVVLIAADGADLSSAEIRTFVSHAFEKGAAYFVCWGPRCEVVHDRIDKVLWDLLDETDDTVVLTTWHEHESLEYALWFALNVAWPAPAYEDTCKTLLAVSIANIDWANTMESLLGDPSHLNRLALENE